MSLWASSARSAGLAPSAASAAAAEAPSQTFPFECEGHPCFLIAEIGVNHNGSVDLARKMVDAAQAAGADAVKFQTFTAKALVTRGTPKVAYQNSTTAPDESHFDMIRSLELSRPDHETLIRHCRSAGIEFVSTPYDLVSARFLLDAGVRLFKTASADLVDLPLQSLLAASGRPVILATGMATLEETEEAVACYREAGNPRIVLLHCVSNYPCSDASLNLRAVQTLAQAFEVPVGFSDHSIGSSAACLAVALGARVVEKHFTLDKNLPGPDHLASSTPEEFEDLVRAVRRAESQLGSPVKECQPEERQMASVSRKSWVLARDLSAGHRLSDGDLVLKRPGTGLAARDWPRLQGRRLRRALPEDHGLRWEDLEA